MKSLDLKSDLDSFSYSCLSHLPLLEPYAQEMGYDVKLLHSGDLYYYQITFIYAFMRMNLPRGCRILEIGNGSPRVFNALSKYFEMWGIVPAIHEAKWIGASGRVIIGSLHEDAVTRTNEHFDAAYSVGITDLWKPNERDKQRAAVTTMMRMLKPNAPSLHSFCAIIKDNHLLTHPIARALASPEAGRHWVAPETTILADTDRMVMSEQAYQNGWEKFTGKTYAEFGTPISLNLLGNKANVAAVEFSEAELPTPENFNNYGYAKKTHLALLGGMARDLCGRDIDFSTSDLKHYQDLLVYAFIRRNIPLGSRILDIGGGYSRVLSRLYKEYECWCLDKMEGQGKGPTDVISTPYRLVRDYMGNFNAELPDAYFELAFSISTVEHIPFDQPTVHAAFIRDIDRVLKIGGYSLHAVDVCLRGEWVWHNPMLNAMYSVPGSLGRPVSWINLLADPNAYTMSEAGFQKAWQPLTRYTYSEMGLPTSVNLLWRKER